MITCASCWLGWTWILHWGGWLGQPAESDFPGTRDLVRVLVVRSEFEYTLGRVVDKILSTLGVLHWVYFFISYSLHFLLLSFFGEVIDALCVLWLLLKIKLLWVGIALI
jgi:hypothetical protein